MKISKLVYLLLLATVIVSCENSTDPELDESSYPIQLKSSAVNNFSVDLSWTFNQSLEVKEIRIFRSGHKNEIENDTSLIFIDSLSKNSHMDGYLSENSNYYYRILTKYENDITEKSNILNVKTDSWLNLDESNILYELNYDSKFKNFGQEIKGVTFDGINYWIMLYTSVGGYYDNNSTQIIQYNTEKDSIISQFNYNDTYIVPEGLIFDNNYFWALWGNYLKKIDPSTGEIINTIILNNEMSDITFDGEKIIVTGINNSITKINTMTGLVENEISLGNVSSNSVGIASKNSELWIIYNHGNYLCIYNNKGQQIGVASCDILEEWNGQLKLSFIENKLLIIDTGNVYILDVIKTN